MNAKTKQELIFQTLYSEGMRRGAEAAKACCPAPMTVVEHANMLDDSSPIRQAWYVPEGVCGFA